MTDKVPVPDDIERVQQQLRSSLRHYRRFAKRLQAIQVFRAQTVSNTYKENDPRRADRSIEKSVLKRQDDPRIQSIIERSDRYLEAMHSYYKADEAGLQELALDWHKEARNQLDHLDRALSEANKHLLIMCKMIVDLVNRMAQLFQQDRHHNDKMSIARSANPMEADEKELLRIVAEAEKDEA